jgi:DNA-binding transcriptional MerR regulator
MSSAAFAYAQKSAEAFRTISEVAIELDVPQHVLRFWESRFAQVKPVKRAGGRRYYRPDDIDLLKGIRALLYTDGLTIKGVQKVLKERGLRHVADIGRGGKTQPPIVETRVIEKIVYVEKPAPAKKVRPDHLRSVSRAASLPFFDLPEAAAAPANEVRALVAEVAREMDTEPAAKPVAKPVTRQAAAPVAEDGLAAGERARLTELLDELTGLKARLRAARKRVR